MSDFSREYDTQGAKDDLFNPPKPVVVNFADDAVSNVKSKLNMFDPANPDIGLFNVVDGELVKIAGSELLIFAYVADENYDTLYDENRAKTHYRPPALSFGHYDPRPIEENLSEFGIELTNDQVFTFNKQTVERQIGRRLIPGDVIKPKFQNLYYEVFEVQEDSFESYGVFHLVCSARVMRDASEVTKTITGQSDAVVESVDGTTQMSKSSSRSGAAGEMSPAHCLYLGDMPYEEQLEWYSKAMAEYPDRNWVFPTETFNFQGDQDPKKGGLVPVDPGDPPSEEEDGKKDHVCLQSLQAIANLGAGRILYQVTSATCDPLPGALCFPATCAASAGDTVVGIDVVGLLGG